MSIIYVWPCTWHAQCEESPLGHTSREQSAGQSDVVSGEVMRLTNVGGACGAHHLAVCRSFLLPSLLHTIAVRSPYSPKISDKVVNSSTTCNIMQVLQESTGDLLLLPRNGGAAFQAQQHSIQAIVGHTAHRVSSNSVEVPS